MDSTYDLFEVLPDGALIWRRSALGEDAALQALQSLAEKSQNEIRVMHLTTKSVLASTPARRPHGNGNSSDGDGAGA